MSEPLRLLDQLLAKARHLEKLGCRQEAERLLAQLAGFRQLPEAVALEVRTRLALLLLRQRQYGAARHHLTAALVLRPRRALTHYLLALAADARGKGDVERALEHARQAVRVAPHQAKYLVLHGTLLLRVGKLTNGLTRLEQALAQAPGELRILNRVVRGLIRAELRQEARRVVQAALFLQPRSPALLKLWSDVRFQEVRGEQE